MIRRLSHLCFTTDQLEAMQRFYTDVLGFKLKFDFRNRRDELMGVLLDCGDSTFIEIFDRHKKSEHWGHPLAQMGGGQYNHFAIEVTGIKDFYARLVAQGVKASAPEVGLDHSVQVWLQDPDGNAIELMEYTANSLQLLGGTAR